VRVVLLTHTPNPIRTLYVAARTCYSDAGPSQIEAKDEEVMKRLIKNIYISGHESILEHVSFTFGIEGVSRVLTHQLVRHRLASYSQQSQRYVKVRENYVIPPSIKKNKEALSIFEKGLNDINKIYENLINMGIPKEDARFILPNATKTNIVMTMNLRELIHTSELRLCFRAQWEIRMLFTYIKREVKRVDKFLASLLNPICIRLGYCPEKESCGLRPIKKEVIGDKD